MAGELAPNYIFILNSLKEKIRLARIRAIKSVNAELLKTYWEIGKTILDQQEQQGWGTKVVERLAKDLKIEFPDMKGLSTRNFQYMRAFAAAYPYFPFVQGPLAQSENPGEPIVQGPLAQFENPDKPIVQGPLAQSENPGEPIVQGPLAQFENSDEPIGIAEYKLTEVLPEDIKGKLPAIEDIEQRMIEELNDLQTPTEKKMDQLNNKIASLNRLETNTTATQLILNNIFDHSLKPLYKAIFERLKLFKEAFISMSFSWHGSFENIQTLEELENKWKDGNLLTKTRNIQFVYKLNGLKKAGVDGHDIEIELDFIMEMYWYGLTIVNYNNGYPGIQKPYSVQLSQIEINKICDTITEQVIFAIENQAGLSSKPG